MTKSTPAKLARSAAPLLGQRARETQAFNAMVPMPIALAEDVRRASAINLNQLLADTITLRDLYKKHHWQVSGPTFYQLHLLFDKHFGEQNELVDQIAERIMMLGGVSVAMAAGRGGDDPDSAASQGTRGGARPDLAAAARARDRAQGSADDGPAGGRGRRRRHQRPAGQQRDPHQRDAGLVRRRARGRCAAGPRRRAERRVADGFASSSPVTTRGRPLPDKPAGVVVQCVFASHWRRRPDTKTTTCCH